MKLTLARRGMILLFAVLALTAVMPLEACHKRILEGPERLPIYTYATWTFEIAMQTLPYDFAYPCRMIVEDVIPAEFKLVDLWATEGEVQVITKGKGKGSTHIVWEIEEYTHRHIVYLYVTIETRTNPSGKKVGLTSEGWHLLNEGAIATWTFADGYEYTWSAINEPPLGPLLVYAYEP